MDEVYSDPFQNFSGTVRIKSRSFPPGSKEIVRVSGSMAYGFPLDVCPSSTTGPAPIVPLPGSPPPEPPPPGPPFPPVFPSPEPPPISPANARYSSPCATAKSSQAYFFLVEDRCNNVPKSLCVTAGDKIRRPWAAAFSLIC